MKEKFIKLWEKYFGKSELPICFYYSDTIEGIELVEATKNHNCLIGTLSKVRKGKSIAFGAESFSCFGGKRYFGFSTKLSPNFEYFLSCGIPGKLEGERYRKSPELVKKLISNSKEFVAPNKYIVFKRWDKLENDDKPLAVIFFAKPDVLSGLFTLSGFEEQDAFTVIAPFSAGCGSIVAYPIEKNKPVIGMFDVSARPYVENNILTFTIPYDKFLRMVNDMEESFLITSSWERVQKRINKDS